MTKDDRLALLHHAVKQEGSQTAVARKIGKSSATVSLILKGRYTGNTEAVLDKVEEVYSDRQIPCPVLRDIPLGRCAEERRTPFSASNPLRVKMFKACRSCRHNVNKGEK